MFVPARRSVRAGIQTAWDWTANTHAAFLFGVSTLAATCLMWGLVPEWIPFAYTVQCGFYLPVRVYTYKRKAWHYFLFGTCTGV